MKITLLPDTRLRRWWHSFAGHPWAVIYHWQGDGGWLYFTCHCGQDAKAQKAPSP